MNLTLDSCSTAPRSRGHSAPATSSMPAAAAAGGATPAGCADGCCDGCLPGAAVAAGLQMHTAVRWSTTSQTQRFLADVHPPSRCQTMLVHDQQCGNKACQCMAPR